MTKNTTVALNGKVYDSVSGKVVHEVKSEPEHTQSHPRTTAQAVHHRAQRPKTLMRDIVKRPKLGRRSALPSKKPGPSKVNEALLTPISLARERIDRSLAVPRSKLVSRFNDFADQPRLVKKTMPLAVKKAPVDIISHHHVPPVLTAVTSLSQDLFTVAANQVEESLNKHETGSNKTHHKVRKSGRKSKLFVVSSATLAIAVFVGFFAYQNAPSAAFRLAAKRAGVRASLPGYKPSGYAMKGPLQSAPGQITIRFKSNSDERSFTVTQRSSNWNSESLLDNYVATNRRNYQTVSDKGKTVYIYDDSNATWVDGGIWYQIESDSNLSSDQLLNIAASM